MPSSTTSAFSACEDFRSALEAFGVRDFLTLKRSEFLARLTVIRLDKLVLLAATEQVPRVAVLSVPANSVLIGFVRRDGSEQAWNGVRIPSTELVTLTGAHRAYWRIAGPISWRAIWMATDILAEFTHALEGKPRTPLLPGTSRQRPDSDASGRLLRLHGAAIQRTVRTPEAPLYSDAARGLEQQIIVDLVDSLEMGTHASALGSSSDLDLLDRLEHLGLDEDERRISTANIAFRLGTTTDRLVKCCRTVLDMSPLRYVRHRSCGIP